MFCKGLSVSIMICNAMVKKSTRIFTLLNEDKGGCNEAPILSAETCQYVCNITLSMLWLLSSKAQKRKDF